MQDAPFVQVPHGRRDRREHGEPRLVGGSLFQPIGEGGAEDQFHRYERQSVGQDALVVDVDDSRMVQLRLQLGFVLHQGLVIAGQPEEHLQRHRTVWPVLHCLVDDAAATGAEHFDQFEAADPARQQLLRSNGPRRRDGGEADRRTVEHAVRGGLRSQHADQQGMDVGFCFRQRSQRPVAIGHG